jgi:energy-coupling factor transporter ATP-binding protein EcfA2
MGEDPKSKVVPFPAKDDEKALDPTVEVATISPEEHARRIMNEVTRLANLSEVERAWQLRKRAEELDIDLPALREMVNAEVRRKKAEADKKAKEEADIDKRAAAKQKKQEKEAKDKATAELEAAKKAEKEQQKAKREAEGKAKEKQKGFATIQKLPVAHHEAELSKLAKRLGEDETALRSEFAEFIGVTEGTTLVETEAWPEPVDLAELLNEIESKIAKHVVMPQAFQRTGVVLGVAQAWPHNQIATHSPIVAATSPEADSGKTTLLNTIARLVPKASINIEMTGPSLFRLVDAHQPSLILDEADDLFERRNDLRHIINASWTRGATIPRVVNVGGALITYHFNIFCPKFIGLLGGKLPRTLRTRAIEIKMVPKRPDEQVEPFEHVDDADFAVLRKKLARFTIDHAATLKTMRPTVPAGMNNRSAANWRLMLSIAELAGGPWPERAREAAECLTRSGRQPSDSVHLLAEFKKFADSGKVVITSKAVMAELRKDPFSRWMDFNRGKPITEMQVARLLEPYGIRPRVVHPSKQSTSSPRGYVLADFADAFARYVTADLHTRTSPTKSKTRMRKRTKRRRPRK